MPGPPVFPASARPTARTRGYTGLDVYQASDEAPKGEVVAGPNGKMFFDVGGQRSASSAAWQAMSEAERALYNARAQDMNQERARVPAVSADTTTNTVLSDHTP